MMDERWLEILGSMVHGIYALTCADGELMNAMIASWVTQVSYEPPMVMVAVHPNRYSHKLIDRSGSFALHLLGQNQKHLLSRFKQADPESKFSSLQWSKGKTGCPILRDCLSFVECLVAAKYTPGNHSLFVGEVVDAGMLSTGTPMCTLDYSGYYMGKA